MRDPVYHAFLARQHEEGMALAAASDLVDLWPFTGDPPDRYVARFGCTGLVRRGTRIQEAGCFEVGIWFPSDYLRRAEPSQVLTWLGPREVFHPNISHRLPFICVGRLSPGTALVDLVYQCFEIITWQKVTMREDDALNPGACGWAREHHGRLPVDRRPLKWRAPGTGR